MEKPIVWVIQEMSKLGLDMGVESEKSRRFKTKKIVPASETRADMDISFKKIFISCGGTGGHFYPGLTLAHEVKRQGLEAKLIMAGKGVAEFSEKAEKEKVKVIKLNEFRSRGGILGKFSLLLNTLRAFFKAWRVMGNERPDAVLGMGSFASFPVCMAAVFRRVPLYLHEGNAVVGKANVWLTRFAKMVYFSLPVKNYHRVKCDDYLVGFPVRRTLVEAARKADGDEKRKRMCKVLGLDEDRRTILIFGGSQGAKAINDVFIKNIPSFFKDEQFQVLHIVGFNTDEDVVSNAYRRAKIKHSILKYAEKMEHCYEIADLAFCRAGASSIFEMGLFGVPAVFCPLPSVSDDHQTANAEVVTGFKAGYMIPQDQFNGESLFEMVNLWLDEPDRFERMGIRMKEHFGDKDVANEIISHLLIDLETH